MTWDEWIVAATFCSISCNPLAPRGIMCSTTKFSPQEATVHRAPLLAVSVTAGPFEYQTMVEDLDRDSLT